MFPQRLHILETFQWNLRNKLISKIPETSMKATKSRQKHTFLPIFSLKTTEKRSLHICPSFELKDVTGTQIWSQRVFLRRVFKPLFAEMISVTRRSCWTWLGLKGSIEGLTFQEARLTRRGLAGLAEEWRTAVREASHPSQEGYLIPSERPEDVRCGFGGFP